MKIGVISDTHLSKGNCELPKQLIAEFKTCNLIIHAGDLIDICVLEALSKIAKTEAVCGNMDNHNMKPGLEDKKIFNIEGKKICVMHGYGHPDNLVGILKDEFFPEKPDIIIFGHSHKPKNEYIDGVLFFNPGSATDIVYAPYLSYGLIEINKTGAVKAEICKL